MKPFVLKLENLDDIGGGKNVEIDYQLIANLNNVIATNNQNNNKILTYLRKKIAKCHGINHVSRIQVQRVMKGTINAEYTVEDLIRAEKDKLKNQMGNDVFKREFKQFIIKSLKVHPLLFRPKGCKTFDHGGTFQIGPTGTEKTYKQPTGWTRYGLKVLGKYPDGDRWSAPFMDDKNWYRVYHGTASVSGLHLVQYCLILLTIDDQKNISELLQCNNNNNTMPNFIIVFITWYKPTNKNIQQIGIDIQHLCNHTIFSNVSLRG